MSAKENQREVKRQKILKSALGVFARKGYKPAVLDDVARKARIAKGTLYLYFKDKEDIYYHTVLYVLDALEAQIMENIRPEMGHVDLLKNVAYSQLDFFAQNPDHFRLFFNMLSSGLMNIKKRLIEQLMSRQTRLVDYMQQIIEEGKESGTIRTDIETSVIVYSFVGMMNQAIQNTCIMNQGKAHDVERVVESIMTILLGGISTAAGAQEVREAMDKE